MCKFSFYFKCKGYTSLYKLYNFLHKLNIIQALSKINNYSQGYRSQKSILGYVKGYFLRNSLRIKVNQASKECIIFPNSSNENIMESGNLNKFCFSHQIILLLYILFHYIFLHEENKFPRIFYRKFNRNTPNNFHHI